MKTPTDLQAQWDECRRQCIEAALLKDTDVNLAKANVFYKCSQGIKELPTPPGTWWL